MSMYTLERDQSARGVCSLVPRPNPGSYSDAPAMHPGRVNQAARHLQHRLRMPVAASESGCPLETTSAEHPDDTPVVAYQLHHQVAVWVHHASSDPRMRWSGYWHEGRMMGAFVGIDWCLSVRWRGYPCHKGEGCENHENALFHTFLRLVTASTAGYVSLSQSGKFLLPQGGF
jgi:hypothetical protein